MARRIVKLPTPMEMASYVWFSNACALGIFFEFSDYKRFIERSDEYKNVPSPILQSLKWLVLGIFCLVFFMIASPYFDVEMCYAPEYMEYSVAYRVFYFYMAMNIRRFYYYNPFCMSTGAVIASGFGYNGRDKGDDKWDKVISVFIWELETSSSAIEMLRYWNHQVHLWLKFYVMGRLVKPGQRPGAFANAMTFLVSAFWHGFYPTYYWLFVIAAFISEATKDVYKARSLVPLPSIAKVVLGNIFSMLCLDYCGILQVALTFERGSHFVIATWGIIPVGLVVFLIFSRTFGLVPLALKMEKAKAAKVSGEEPKPASSADNANAKKTD